MIEPGNAEMAAPEDDSWYRALVEQAVDAIFVHDETGRLLDVNRKACEILGFTREELLTMTVGDVDPEAILAGKGDLWGRVLAGEQFTFESNHRRKDGSSTSVEITLGPVTLPGGPAILGTVRDVSQRKGLEKEYRQLIDGMNDTAFVIGFDGKFLEVNERAIKTLGYSRGELLAMGPSDIDPYLTAADIGGLIESMTSDERQVFETQHRAKDGGVIPVEISSSLVSYQGKTAILSIARDITERKHAEESLRALTQRTEAMLQTIPDIIVEVDANKVYTWANEAGRSFFGEDVIGREAAFYFEGEQDTYAKVAPLFAGESDASYLESWQRRRDGKKRLLAWWCRSLKDDEGSVTGALSTARDITEHRRQEEVYRQLIDGMNDTATVIDFNGKFLDVNARSVEALGYSRSELLTMGPADIDPYLDQDRILKMIHDMKSDKLQVFETQHRTKDGKIIPVEISSSLVSYLGEPAILSVARDMTERKALEQSLDLTQVLVNQAGDLVYWFGPEGDILFASDSTCRRLGYEREEMLRMTIFDVDPAAPKPWTDHWRSLRNHGSLTFETIHRTKEGVDIPVEVTATLVEYEGKEYDLAVSRDITERRRAEELLGLRARQQTAVAALGQQALASVDLQALMDSLVVTVAGTLDVEYCSVLELVPDRGALWMRAGVGWKEGMVGHETVSVGLDSQAGYTLHSRAPVIVEDLRSETRFLAPASLVSDHRVVSGLTVAIGFNTEPYGVLSAHSTRHRSFTEDDVHFLQAAANILAAAIQRKEAEEALRESEARNRQMFDASPDAVFVLDGSGRYVDCNQTAVDRYGYSRDEILGLVAGDLSTPDSRRKAARQVQEAVSTGTAFEWRHLLKDGTELPVEVRAVPLSVGGQPGTLTTVRDLTERKRAEEERERLQSQLYQAVKMESVGRLAGGVAHDFNNMLGVILGHAELALAQVDPLQPLHSSLQEIRKAAEHSAQITQQLLAFARKQIVTPKVLDLNERVEGILLMLRRLIGEDIELVWTPGTNLGRVRMDPSQIDQILANLCVNARDAIQGLGAGAISIETSSATVDEAFCAQNEDCVPGDYAVLRVSDSGRGMDRETLAHLFEPFFTTKEVGKGTGLGLATVYGIVKQNDGFVMVSSQPDKGTAFDLYLPVYTGRVVEEQPRATAPALPSGQGELVLLVEDETALLALTATILTGLNYNVLSAAMPSEALALARAHPGQVALLVTDIVMPEMNGEDLARHIRALQPGIKTLFISGYAAEAVSSREFRDKGVGFLQKPFSSRDLATTARSLLDQG